MDFLNDLRIRLFGEPVEEPDPSPSISASRDYSDAVPGRQERAAGRILDDEGLRGDLTDDEYQPLLDWALAVTDRLAERTATLDDDQAEPVLDHGISAVRQVLRLAQEVVVAHAEGRTEDRRYSLDDISQAWKPSLVGGDDATAPATIWRPLQALADRLDAESDLSGDEVTTAIAAALSLDNLTASAPGAPVDEETS